MSLFKARDWWKVRCGRDEDFDQGGLCIYRPDNDSTLQSTDSICYQDFSHFCWLQLCTVIHKYQNIPCFWIHRASWVSSKQVYRFFLLKGGAEISCNAVLDHLNLSTSSIQILSSSNSKIYDIHIQNLLNTWLTCIILKQTTVFFRDTMAHFVEHIADIFISFFGCSCPCDG